MRREFTKDEVIELIYDMSPPTPTDKDHDAIWWNTDFGKAIKIAFDVLKEQVITEVQQMTEY